MGVKGGPARGHIWVGKLVIWGAAAVLLATAVALLTGLKDLLWVYPWLQSALLALPSLVLLSLGLHHSSEANRLSRERNDLASELDEERNRHLATIGAHLSDPVAEKNLDLLRRSVGAGVTVTEGDSNWGGDTTVAEVDAATGIATLFHPRTPGGQAWSQQVRCQDLAITEGQGGRLSLDVRSRHGQPANLGEIRGWHQRDRDCAAPAFPRGRVACRALYKKQGTGDARQLIIYAASDGSDHYLLETGDGAQFQGNGRDVSKRFLGVHVDLLADGFERREFGRTGGGGLFVG